jgi:hypothetical protein
MKMDKNKSLQTCSEQDNCEYKAKSKFELINCPRNGKNCKAHLVAINEKYSDSDYYYHNKEYQESILALNNAFNKTFELNQETCASCARVFRDTMIQTLQNIHMELHSMTTGFFKNKRYKDSYILADNVLNDFINKGD